MAGGRRVSFSSEQEGLVALERLRRAGRFPVQPLRAESWDRIQETGMAEWLSGSVTRYP